MNNTGGQIPETGRRAGRIILLVLFVSIILLIVFFDLTDNILDFLGNIPGSLWDYIKIW